jgi:glycosyltransferase involved in cell wall biosynthesis
MLARRRGPEDPYFSICIPQYNRTSFLLEALRTLASQTYRDFEICISDDRSTDGRQAEVTSFLESSGVSFVYRVQPRNTGYDGNLRSAIALARGRYCLLMGNDDALAGAGALAALRAEIDARGPAGVIITDFEDFATGARACRIRHTANYGAGPEVAAGHFRNFSFVSGVLLEREPAQAVASDRWDSSEMYQTFIACRLIAAGRPLLELGSVLIRKDIRVPNESVDSYACKPRLLPCPIIERRLPLSQLGRLVADAVAPHVTGRGRRTVIERILLQMLLFTYPFWIIEYRRVQSWRYAVGICLGMRPRIVTEGLELGSIGRLKLRAVYAFVTAGGLAVPTGVFGILRGRLYRIAKAAFRR